MQQMINKEKPPLPEAEEGALYVKTSRIYYLFLPCSHCKVCVVCSVTAAGP